MGGSESTGGSISEETKSMALEVFRAIDTDCSNTIEMNEMVDWWQENYPTVNARAMLDAIDEDRNGVISIDEWMKFWDIVKQNGHSDKDIQQELKRLKSGSSWNLIG